MAKTVNGYTIAPCADLTGAYLTGAYLRGADLSGADLRGANLTDANLYDADLSGANLYGANLTGANLSCANLSGADLYGADLRSANPYGANLSGANLSGAKNLSEIAAAQLSIVPEKGSYTAWKKCGSAIVELLIPAEARRSNATGRKCRAEFAIVIAIHGARVATSDHDGRTQYIVGQRVTCDRWENDRWIECAGGIHHFITRAEAEAY
jgi:hypothetical protein